MIEQFESPLKCKDLDFFRINGYVVVKNAVSHSVASSLAEVMLEFQKRVQRRINHTTDEYKDGVIGMYHHPLQWELRQSSRIYSAFSQLWNDPNLWVSINRGKIVPPASYQGTLNRGFLHWDINTKKLPEIIPLQGLVALTETTGANQGGFQCVPGFHHSFYEWQKGQPINRNPYLPDQRGLNIVPIKLSIGDLVIWNALLPHGNCPNLSSQPRIVQFVKMYPSKEYPKEVLKQRLNMWENKLPEHTQDIDMNLSEPKLTQLGKKLVGLASWIPE